MKTLILAALLGAPLLPVGAEPLPCAPRAEMLESLARQYQEHVIGRGIGPSGVLFEILASADGTTWTFIVTADGLACLIAAGENWRALKADGPT